MAELYLKTGECIFVDDDLLPELEGKAWKLERGTLGRTYHHEGKTRWEALATAVTGERAGLGSTWHHLDDNWRNFRRDNLQLRSSATHLRPEDRFVEGDLRQRLTRKNPTGFVGVHKAGNKYRAVASVDGKQTYLGLFQTPEEAARAYDRALVQQGLEAVNFPMGGESRGAAAERAEARRAELGAEVAALLERYVSGPEDLERLRQKIVKLLRPYL